MKITFMLFYFDPEEPTINHLYRPLWEKLMAAGHHINIITPNPTRGVSASIQAQYTKLTVEERAQMTIYRVPCFTYKPAKFSKFKLFRRYVSVSTRLSKMLKKVASDIVFVSTNPPLLYSYLVTKHCHKKGIPVVYNVQDIYPDNIFNTKSVIYKIFNPLQILSLKRATKIITISETMRHTLLAKGDFNHKISVVYNFDISDVDHAKALPVTYFDPQKFNVCYAGNIGYVQDIDVILAAAKRLLHDPDIVFHIFGEGSQAARISKRIIDENIVNTISYPALSVAESGALYKNADVNIISILPGIIKTALPLKTASVINSGKPFVFIGVDDKDHQEAWINDIAGLVRIPHRNYAELSRALKSLKETKPPIVISPKIKNKFLKTTFVENYFNAIIESAN